MPEEKTNDHDLLTTLHVKVNFLIEQVGKLTDDHEKRIRSLEKQRWILLGSFLAVQFIVTTYLLWRQGH